MPNFIDTRSFLSANSEGILENIAARRTSRKIDTEDLFGENSEESNNKMIWLRGTENLAKYDILLREKESLGLYVSGNPLDDYVNLVDWCRQTAARDDIFLIIVEKIRKIFTKKNAMMFALQLTTPDVEVEGVIFPKNALALSPLLEEKSLYWVTGKVQQSKKSKAREEESKENGASEAKEGEIKEFDELPKLIIEGLTAFENGILALFEHEDIPLAINRQSKLKGVNWLELKTSPWKFDSENQSEKTVLKTKASLPILKLSKSLGTQKLKEISQQIKPAMFPGSVEVKIEIENGNGFKSAKGTYWLALELATKYG